MDISHTLSVLVQLTETSTAFSGEYVQGSISWPRTNCLYRYKEQVGTFKYKIVLYHITSPVNRLHSRPFFCIVEKKITVFFSSYSKPQKLGCEPSWDRGYHTTALRHGMVATLSGRMVTLCGVGTPWRKGYPVMLKQNCSYYGM